jgi:hypothetical protein
VTVPAQNSVSDRNFPTCSLAAARLEKQKGSTHMSIRATLVNIIGVLLFFTIDVVFCIAIIEFSVVNSIGGKLFLPVKRDREQ